MLTKTEEYKKPIFIALFILLAILPFFLYLRGSLGVDEASYMFVGNSILHGAVVYKDCLTCKLPGTQYLLALIFFIFGKSFYAARAVLFIFNALSAVIIFLIGRKLWNKETGMVSSILFLIGILIPAYEGYYVMTEPFMVFFGLLGVLSFFKSEHKIYLVLSGFLIGVSTLFKQSGALFLAAIFMFYLLKLWIPANRTKEYLKDSIKNLSLIICSFSIPILVVVFYFWSLGALDGLIYWVFTYVSSDYGRSFYVSNIFYQFIAYSILWVLSFVSILFIAYEFITKKSKDVELFIFIVIWFLVFLYPFTIRQYGHYVIQILPSACLLASVALIKLYPILSLRAIKESLSKENYLKIFAIVCLLGLVLSSFAFITYSEYGLQKSRSIRFDEQLKTAEYIKAHTSANEKIVSFSYEPSIHFLSDRNPPMKFIYYNMPEFDEKYEYHVIEQIKENNVGYIIDHRIVNGKSRQAQHIHEFILENYEIEKQIGVFDIYRKKV